MRPDYSIPLQGGGNGGIKNGNKEFGRNNSIGSRSLAPSDSASNFDMDHRELEQQQQLQQQGLYERGVVGHQRHLSDIREELHPGDLSNKSLLQPQPHDQSLLPAPIPLRHFPSKSLSGLSYVDENGLYYTSNKTRPASMVLGEGEGGYQGDYEEMEGKGLIKGDVERGNEGLRFLGEYDKVVG